MSEIEPDLRETLDRIAADCRDLTDPWWLIGSTAARLIGLDEPVGDVDLLVSERDGQRLLARWNLTPLTPEPSQVFRSRLFARWCVPPMPVQLMAGLHVRGEPLVPATRMRLSWASSALFLPDLDEQAAICRRFARPKDLARAERLESQRQEIGFAE